VQDHQARSELRLRQWQLASWHEHWRHNRRLHDAFAWHGLYLRERQLAPAEHGRWWHDEHVQNRQARGQLGLRQWQLAAALDGACILILHNAKAGLEFRVREWQLAPGRHQRRHVERDMHHYQAGAQLDLQERQLAPALVLSRANTQDEMTARAA